MRSHHGRPETASSCASVRSLRSQRGFSMVELLVTIVLAGIIFAAMVPFFANALKHDGKRQPARHLQQHRPGPHRTDSPSRLQRHHAAQSEHSSESSERLRRWPLRHLLLCGWTDQAVHHHLHRRAADQRQESHGERHRAGLGFRDRHADDRQGFGGGHPHVDLGGDSDPATVDLGFVDHGLVQGLERRDVSKATTSPSRASRQTAHSRPRRSGDPLRKQYHAYVDRLPKWELDGWHGLSPTRSRCLASTSRRSTPTFHLLHNARLKFDTRPGT